MQQTEQLHAIGCRHMQLSQQEQAGVADWYQFTAGELPWFDAFPTVMPSAAQGSLILWDSRTAHAVSAHAWHVPLPRGFKPQLHSMHMQI